MKTMKFLSVIFSMIFLAACASSVELSKQDRSRISTIKISRNVVLPKDASYVGGLASLGALGALMQGSSDSDRIKKYLKQNNIDVGQIVYRKFKMAARENKYLAARLDPAGNATIQIEVKIYGLGVKNGLSDEFKPMLGYYARMKDPAGKLVWEKYDYIGFDDVPMYTLKQYFSDPKYFREAYGKAATIIADGILKTL